MAKKLKKDDQLTLAFISKQINLLRQDVREILDERKNKANDDQENSVAYTKKMFEELAEATLPSPTQTFIDSLFSGFEVYGSLTDLQFEALKRNYNRFINNIPFYVRRK